MVYNIMDNCLFCKIASGAASAYTVWENEDFLAFLDINPVNPGHTLLIPREHVDYLFDLEEPLYSALFQVARQLAAPLQIAMQAKRIGVVVEGFGVAHLHVHLIPINSGNELDPKRARPATAAELTAVASAIKTAIRNELA